jgi:N-methylhydantoinase A
VKFGTTIVINTFLQRSGARTALVTTAGFRDLLELRRGNRPVPFDLRYRRDPVLVPRHLRHEVTERIAADGSIVRPLEPDALAAVADRLRQDGVEAVAVSFLNSYANSRHEEQAAETLRGLLPGVYVTAGTELTREWYEYERTSTAAANAYVGPIIATFIAGLSDRLRRQGFARSFFLMASHGGVFSAERARRHPVMLLESGPVGGCIGAAAYARDLGLKNVIAFDMGGTTAKCALVADGAFDIRSPYYVGGPERGFPVRGGVIDIVEIGAGGGSIAWFDPQGRLNVGPHSAGSNPGPVAYGRGGTEPTITDANVALGRIGAGAFLGGAMSLDRAAAEAAIRTRVAEPLGLAGPGGLADAARGIIALGATLMAGAIKRVTIERGFDPREFSLFAFGGGGPLHAAALARELNIPEVIVPPAPGLFSALGMLMAQARIEETASFLRPLAAPTLPELAGAFARLEDAVARTLAREVPAADVTVTRSAEMRYRGQKHSIRVALAPGCGEADIRRQFESVYERRYGHAQRQGAVELVNLVVTAVAEVDRLQPADLRAAALASASAGSSERDIVFGAGGAVRVPVFARGDLPVGLAGAGPAAIEEYGATTLVGPDDRFAIGRLGEIRIRFD